MVELYFCLATPKLLKVHQQAGHSLPSGPAEVYGNFSSNNYFLVKLQTIDKQSNNIFKNIKPHKKSIWGFKYAIYLLLLASWPYPILIKTLEYRKHESTGIVWNCVNHHLDRWFTDSCKFGLFCQNIKNLSWCVRHTVFKICCGTIFGQNVMLT